MAAAIATMTRAERKGTQFDSSIMVFMAISDPGNEHRARNNKLERGEAKTLIQLKKDTIGGLYTAWVGKPFLILIKDEAIEIVDN